MASITVGHNQPGTTSNLPVTLVSPGFLCYDLLKSTHHMFPLSLYISDRPMCTSNSFYQRTKWAAQLVTLKHNVNTSATRKATHAKTSLEGQTTLQIADKLSYISRTFVFTCAFKLVLISRNLFQLYDSM